MRTFRYDKLVRDKIVPAMKKKGDKVVWRKLSDKEFAAEIAKKLEEELDELMDGVGKDRERDLKELADLAEIYDLAWNTLDHDKYYDLLDSSMTELENGIDMWEIDPDELIKAKAEKIKSMGGFKDRIYIETVSLKDDDVWIKRYLETPDKYPEVK